MNERYSNKMSLTIPPYISHDYEIELCGQKGKEIYHVDKVTFYKCKSSNGDLCIHDILISYIRPFSTYQSTLMIHDVSYEDLVRKNYILFLRNSNPISAEKEKVSKCKLQKVPKVE
jgi:hypothetical protein